jgi:hypothetical protein
MELLAEPPKSAFDLLTSKPEKLEFLDIDLGFQLDPRHLLRWLEAAHTEDEYDSFEITGIYSQDVACECEFSCLYMALLLDDMTFEKEPVIYDGSFGFWDHFWTAFFIDGKEYFVDMTLAQFMPEAPKVAITEARKYEKAYRWHDEIFPKTFSHYLEYVHAYDRFPEPIDIV